MMFGDLDWVIYSTSMGPEDDPEPLISPRGDGPDERGDEPDTEAEARAGRRREREARRSKASDAREPAIGEPIDPPAGEAGSRPVQPREDRVESAHAVGEPVGGSRTRSHDRGARPQSPNMLPTRRGRGYLERTFVRVVATGGIVGISVAIAAIMSSSNSAGWIIGLVVSLVSVVLAALLWSSRVL